METEAAQAKRTHVTVKKEAALEKRTQTPRQRRSTVCRPVVPSQTRPPHLGQEALDHAQRRLHLRDLQAMPHKHVRLLRRFNKDVEHAFSSDGERERAGESAARKRARTGTHTDTTHTPRPLVLVTSCRRKRSPPCRLEPAWSIYAPGKGEA